MSDWEDIFIQICSVIFLCYLYILAKLEVNLVAILKKLTSIELMLMIPEDAAKAYAKDYSWNEREIRKLEKAQKQIDKILNDYYNHPDDFE